MSFEITKIYTDNPYVDEMVYYTRLMSIDTVLKLKDVADRNESLSSLKNAGIYITCVEGLAKFNTFESYTRTALMSAGITDPLTLEACVLDKNSIPENYRAAAVTAMAAEFIDCYIEQNNYYRMLHGLPNWTENYTLKNNDAIVRAEPNSYGKVIGKIAQDNKVTVTKIYGKWYYLTGNYSGTDVSISGWVDSTNVSIIGDNFDYVPETFSLPDGIVIDRTKPIHLMDNSEALLLDKYGLLDELLNEDPINRQYMLHLGKKSIDIYFARRANRFDVLYTPTIDSDAIERMYRDKLDNNKFYVLRTIYSEAFKYNSDYYDNFIAVLIVLITVVDIISRVQEFIARKEIFDIRSVQYLFKSYGVPFFEEIPLKYQIAMVKNLHTLLKYKSTSVCMVDICSLFGFDNIKVFKYYLLRDRKVDLTTGEYVVAEDENGNEDIDEEYELKFLKLPLEDDLDDYIRVGGNYIDYDEITTGDATWDGGLDHDMVMKNILKEEFNFIRTKYISIDTVYEIAQMSAQQSYFFNFLYDNVDLEENLRVEVPFIEAGKEFKVADLFTLLTVLTYYYRGVKDTIMDTQSKVLHVNGFNFKADLGLLAAEIGAKRVNDIYDIYVDPNTDGDNNPDNDPENIVLDYGSTLHAQEQLKKFKIPTSSIPSFNEMIDIYINNMEVRDELIKGMQEADNKRVYDVYKKLYDALMVVELTMDYYKNPETGDFYRDEEGDATYTEYLKHQDSSLYYVIAQTMTFEDQASRNQYIANVIDSIIYSLEEYIDSDEFQSLFAYLPVMGTEAVKGYIATVINFYKSHKVDFLGFNTIYILDDKNDGYIRLIDDLIQKRFFQKDEFTKLYDKFGINKDTGLGTIVSISYDERVKLIERIYLDIRTWIILQKDDRIVLTDEVYEKLVKLVLHTVIQLTEEITGSTISKTFYETIAASDYLQSITGFVFKDDLGIVDRMWIYDEGYITDNSAYMSVVSMEDVNRIITATSEGDSKASVYISEDIQENSFNAVTENSVASYVEENTVAKTDVVTELDTTNPSDEEVTSEGAVLKALSFRTIEEDQ